MDWSEMGTAAARSKAGRSRQRRDPIPENFRTIKQFYDFWDIHSTADYPEFLEPVKMSVRLKKRIHLLRVADDLVSPLQRRARRHGITLEGLVNRWIRERLRIAG